MYTTCNRNSSDDDIVIDDKEDRNVWSPLTKSEWKERQKAMSEAERFEEISHFPQARPFYFRNRTMPSSPLIDPLEPHVLSDAQYLFSLPSNLAYSCGSMNELPNMEQHLPEIAIAGRSNVGKSSFVNALLNKNVSQTSSTPGRTRRLNYFNVGNYLYLVDLPGYGHAEGNKKKIQEWNELMIEYLTSRPTLKRVFQLIDARHGFFDTDTRFLDLVSKKTAVQFVFTKCDAVNNDQLVALMRQTLDYLDKNYPLVLPIITPTSSRTNEGIEEARGWVYCSTGLAERLALLNNVERARAFSARQKETRIALQEINPSHPIFADQYSKKEQPSVAPIHNEKNKPSVSPIKLKAVEKEIVKPSPKKEIIFGLEEFNK